MPERKRVVRSVGYAELFAQFRPEDYARDWLDYMEWFDDKTRQDFQEAVVDEKRGIVHQPCFAQLRLRLIIAAHRTRDSDNSTTYVPVALLDQESLDATGARVYGLNRKNGAVSMLRKSQEAAQQGNLLVWGGDDDGRDVTFEQALAETLLFRFERVTAPKLQRQLDSGWQGTRGNQPVASAQLDLYFNDDAGRHPAACFCMIQSPEEESDIRVWLMPLTPHDLYIVQKVDDTFSLNIPKSWELKLFHPRITDRRVSMLIGFTAAEMTDDDAAITSTFGHLEEWIERLAKANTRADHIRQQFLDEWMEAGGTTVAFCVVRVLRS